MHAPEGADEAVVGRCAAEIRIECVVIGNIVAVQTARRRSQVRGSVHVGDAEPVEIRRDRGRCVEREQAIELQAIVASGIRGSSDAISGIRRLGCGDAASAAASLASGRRTIASVP